MTPSLPHDPDPFGAEAWTEHDAWCVIPTRSGTILRTNTYATSPSGSMFVAVDDVYGEVLGS